MRKWSLAFLAVALASFLSACDLVSAYRPYWLSPSYYAPQHTYYSSSSSTRHHEHVRSARNRTTVHGSTAASSADSESETPAVSRPSTDHAAPPPAASSAPVSLSLAGDSGDREQAEHLLEKTNASLHRAHRRHLTDAQKQTYERASQLATRARQALADNDCAAASSLAGKALSLASELSGE